MNKVYKYVYGDLALTARNKTPCVGGRVCCVCNKRFWDVKYIVVMRYMQQKIQVNICTETCREILNLSPTIVDTYLSYYGHKRNNSFIDLSQYSCTYMDILP